MYNHLMTQGWFLGIDQGSSSTKCVLLDSEGEVQCAHTVPVSTSVLDHSRIEQDPIELLQSARQCFDLARGYAERRQRRVTAVGLACQRSGVLAWNCSGDVLHRMMTHRDVRTAPQIAALAPHADRVRARTMLPLSPGYAGAKLALLQQHFPQALVGTLDTFLLYRLSDGEVFATEDSMAARTLLYDLERHGWSEELCALFGVDLSRLASVRSSFGVHTHLDGVPVVAMIGDQQAALIAAQDASGEGAVLTLGTIGALCVALRREQQLPGYSTSVLYSDEAKGERKYRTLLEGTVPHCATLVRWLQEQSGVPDPEAFAQFVGASLHDAPLAYLPMGASGTPHWRYQVPNVAARGVRADPHALARAGLCSLGCSLAHQLREVREAGLLSQGQEVIVSGGIAALDALLQFVADAANVILVRRTEAASTIGQTEAAHGATGYATARGAAVAAMLALGYPPPPQRSEGERFSAGDARRAAQRQLVDWERLRECVLAGAVDGLEVWHEC